MADFGRQPFDRGGDHAERGEIHGVAVARDDLRRDRLDCEPQLCCDVGFDARIDLRECADRAGDRAGRDLLARRFQPAPRAEKFGVGDGELEPERGRLGMDAPRAADGRRVFVLAARGAPSAAFSASTSAMEKIGGANELNVVAGVEHVRGRHALVHEPRFRPDNFGQMREKGDDVVFDLALDLVDARGIERRRLLPFAQIFFAAAFGIRPRSAMASAACASISNQMRKRVSGVQIAAICGRV